MNNVIIEKGTVLAHGFFGTFERRPAIRINGGFIIQTDTMPATIDELLELSNTCERGGYNFTVEQ